MIKFKLKITYESGMEQEVTAKLPDFANWEKETGKKAKDISEVLGLWDMLFLAYSAVKRENGEKPMRNFDNWSSSVVQVRSVPDDLPKVSNPEA